MKKTTIFLAAMLFIFAAHAETFYPQIKVNKAIGMTPTNAIDNPAWKNVPRHNFMRLATTVDNFYQAPDEAGSVQYLYDDQYFYIRAEFIDTDIVTYASENGGHFYIQGDLLEVFIKPENANYYWEIYGTPNKFNTKFFFPSRNMAGLPSTFAHKDCGIEIFSKIDGTLNDFSDRDKSLTILMAVPIKELNRPHLQDAKDHPAGTVPFAPGTKWRVQSARYNYNRFFSEYELSSFPQTVNSYHNLKYFAEIELVK